MLKKFNSNFFKQAIKNYFLNNWKGFVLLAPLLILLIIFTIVPIFVTFSNSFNVYPPHTRLESFAGIENFQDVIESESFNDAIKNSTFLMFVATPISLFLGIVFALVLSSIIIKVAINVFTTILYSQFFISSFAIGASFIMLFGEKNILASILNLDISFGTADNSVSILWVYLIFQIWRSLPFNIVLFTFTFNRVNEIHFKNFKNDKLTIVDKFFNVYIFQIKKNFFNIIYTNFIFAALMYPAAIVDFNDLDLVRGHTITSFIYNLFLPLNGSININFEMAYAASFIAFVYILMIIFLIYIVRKKFIFILLKRSFMFLKHKWITNKKGMKHV
ncbi:sugar ABC transporter permease [Mycoplasmopsis agassizii]|uniref:Sugar ABC transporter permease n=1 Tax=Mycoplasmopsis agassizii TaxID=33922 RepID=A0ABX4H4F0_9BACT|nr:sugar ABC transporter permease [Mycoplasmopsis agassizii]PAF54743.1 sugar ABC transporter permease [Mycoplasmopsis agassizii]SMC15884.1 multiple sugar transport system permease protein [Mycoplasmopsis agassizii]